MFLQNNKKKKIITYTTGQFIIKKGTKERGMYIILEGEVEIIIKDEFKEVTLATLKKNDFFGEISLLNDTPRTADVKAKGKTTLACIRSMSELNRLLQKNPKLARTMVRKLTQRLAKTDELLHTELKGQTKGNVLKFMW